MKPPGFDYAAPRELDEAVRILSDGATDAKVLAGGQSLVPLLSMRLAYPDLLVDLRRVPGLDRIDEEADAIRVGAMATQAVAEESHLLRASCPLVPDALTHVAHPQIRSRGTVGGSVAHGDPAAELPAAVVALDASIEVTGPGGTRMIAAGDLYSTTLTTTLSEDEVLTAVRFPKAPPGSGAACVEVARRRGDYALCGAVAQVSVEDGTFREVRLALFGISDTPVRCRAVEDSLRGAEATAAAIESAAAQATDGVELAAEARSDEEYSSHLASVVARRGLEQALERKA